MGSFDVAGGSLFRFQGFQQQAQRVQRSQPKPKPTSHARKTSPQRQHKHPAVKAHSGVSSFEAPKKTSAPQGVAAPSSAPGTGASRPLHGYTPVDVNKLRDALPPQAKHLAQTFNDIAQKYDLNTASLVGLSQHESAGWTSNAFRNKNNAMGISDRHGPIHMSSHAASIEDIAKKMTNPKHDFGKAKTIGDLGPSYAPIGADNDPKGLNKDWVPGVSRMADEWAKKLAPPPQLAPPDTFRV